MRILGVDYGMKRIGLALGDTETGMAFPLRSLTGLADQAAVAEIGAIAEDAEAERIVVGVPRRLRPGDRPGEMEQRALDFVAALVAAGNDVATEDERMTTAMVERGRKEAGVKKSKFDVDAEAAAALLETYLLRTAGK